MADPVTAANGTRTVTLDPGTTLTVTGSSSSTKGAVAVMTAANQPESADQVQGTVSKSYGPYVDKRTVRLYTETGRLDFSVASRLAALPSLQPATVSSDGLTVFSTGVKPLTPVLVYNVDTGVVLGTVQSLADGSWSLTLKTPLSAGDRVGYDPTIVGPYTVVGSVLSAPGQVTGLAAGAPSQTSVPLTWNLPNSGGAPSSQTVEYKKTGDSTWTVASSSVGSSATSYSVTGLAAGTPYQFRVTAVNQAGSGTPSAPAAATTASAPPSSSPGQISTDLSDPNSIGPRV